MNLEGMRYVVFLDTETTGMGKSASIIEIAGTVYDLEMREEVETFHRYCNPYIKYMSKEAEKVHGLTMEFLSTQDSEEVVMRDFYEWLTTSHSKYGGIDLFIAHNISFDLRQIDQSLTRFGLGINIPDEKKFCTMYRIKGNKSKGWKCMLPETAFKTPTGKSWSYKQEAIAQFLGIEYNAHRAIDDVRALVRIFEKVFLNREDKKIKRDFHGF